MLAEQSDPPYLVPIISAAAAFIAGIAPWIISLLRAARAEGRLDSRGLSVEQRRLVMDLRMERDRAYEALVKTQDQHMECVELAARQSERIEMIEERARMQDQKIQQLENELGILRREVHDNEE